jgi:hypothetical protein
MKPQYAGMNGALVMLSTKREVWYRYSCQKCGKKGETTVRNFVCCPEHTRIVLSEVE